jgi:hypothetical protein
MTATDALPTTQQQQEEDRQRLRELLPPGSTVYTILRHTSRSGMLRHISTVIPQDGDINDITWLVARAVGWKINPASQGGLIVHGVGTDMGFHVVHTLSQYLYPDYPTPSALNRRWL